MSSSSRKMLQAAAGSAGGGFYPYTIDNSCRFNDDDSANLYRTPSTAGNRKTWTWSGWLKLGNLGLNEYLFQVGTSYGSADNNLEIAISSGQIVLGVSGLTAAYTSAVFRDPSAWYHIVFACDTTQAAAADRMKVYVNNVQYALDATVYSTQNTDTAVNSTVIHSIGTRRTGGTPGYFMDGYMAEVHFVDGTALDPTSFGQDKNGVWIPKEVTGLTYGTNGFYLDFGNSSALGNDVSGNNNDFTVSGLTSSDQMIDTPTNNFCVINPLAVTNSALTLADGNLSATTPSTGGGNGCGTFAIPTSGKWYFEAEMDTGANGAIGLWEYDATEDYAGYTGDVGVFYYAGNGNKYVDSSASAYGASYTAGDIIGVAVDVDGGTVTFYKNNTSQGSISYDATGLVPCVTDYASGSGSTWLLDFGQLGFTYTPPTDFLALCTANLPEPTLGPNSAENVTDYFAPVLYTGNGTAIGSGGKSVTGVGFQPDMVWIKNRDAADNHMVFDDVRGVTNYISADTNSAEATSTESLSSFDTDGFTLGNNVAVNTNTEDYVAWNWKETSGFFDIVQSTGTGSARTIAHNLGVKPNFIWAKNLNDISSQQVYVDGGQVSDPETDFYALDESIAVQDNPGAWNDTAPTDSVFSVGTYNSVNGSGDPIIYYLFANMEGVCKVGYYTGNGSTTAGPFIYTGFRPAWVMIKRTDSANSWYIHDTSRDTYNGAYHLLYSDGSAAEVTYGVSLDIVSNGFKLQTAGSPYPNGFNASGGSYIFLAFAEMPFKYSNAR